MAAVVQLSLYDIWTLPPEQIRRKVMEEIKTWREQEEAVTLIEVVVKHTDTFEGMPVTLVWEISESSDPGEECAETRKDTLTLAKLDKVISQIRNSSNPTTYDQPPTTRGVTLR